MFTNTFLSRNFNNYCFNHIIYFIPNTNNFYFVSIISLVLILKIFNLIYPSVWEKSIRFIYLFNILPFELSTNEPFGSLFLFYFYFMFVAHYFYLSGAGTPSLPSSSNRDTNTNSHTPYGGTDNNGGSLYPRIPASAPPAEPSSGGFGSNVNSGGYVPPSYPSGPSSFPSAPSNYPSNPSRPNYPSSPSNPSNYPSNPSNPSNYPSNPSNYPSNPSGYGGSRDDNRNNNPYPNPYGNRDRDNAHRGGSSSSDDSGGLSSLLNIFSRGGSNTDRYGSGGSSSSGSSGLDYGSIFNALAGGNRQSGGFGNSGGSNGLSGILSSFGGGGGGSSNTGSNGLSGILSSFGGSNRGSGLQDRFGSNDNTNDNRRQQPAPSDSGSGTGFLSSLQSLFGQQVANSLIQGALSGNRGQNDGGSSILNSIQNRRYGGLFNENTGHAAGSPSSNNSPRVTVSGAGPGGYPTQAPAYPRQAQAQAYPSQAYENNNRRSYTNSNIQSAAPSAQTNQKPAPYGWSVGQH